MRHPGDDEAELEEWEPGDYGEDNEESDTSTCPYCGAPIYEDAERCPICENYISEEEATPRRPWWFMLGAILCLAVALTWAFLG